ncbi:MAG TPA: alginate lyase family protein, partial [Polyangiaceae bacterium]|nr:alginate lyase family protein [Polyangiaceae bacterium]
MISRWIRENPVGQGTGWEPYPLSLRTANWIKWHLGGNTLDREARTSLVQQVRYLRPRLEYHLLANHLLENLKALAIAGCFFAGREADAWREEGLRGLEQQVSEQILPDGGHFERSPMYHSLALEGLLDVHNVLRVFGFEVPRWLSSACRAMLAWAQGMAHPDGEWSQFNDTALGYAARAADLSLYARRLGYPPPEALAPLVVLHESGFVRAEYGDFVLIADVGALGPDYNPAHGHADTLSFELSCHGERFVVDTGISTYETGALRTLERSTGAHNTLVIDAENSSEIWDSFRVARRAKVRGLRAGLDSDSISIVCEHDGYRRLQGRPIHRREWRLTRGVLEITDVVRTSSSHELRAHLHLHPRWRARKLADGTLEAVDETERRSILIRNDTWSIAEVNRYEYAYGFGIREPAQVISLAHRCAGPETLRYRICQG